MPDEHQLEQVVPAYGLVGHDRRRDPDDDAVQRRERVLVPAGLGVVLDTVTGEQVAVGGELIVLDLTATSWVDGGAK